VFLSSAKTTAVAPTSRFAPPALRRPAQPRVHRARRRPGRPGPNALALLATAAVPCLQAIGDGLE